MTKPDFTTEKDFDLSDGGDGFTAWISAESDKMYQQGATWLQASHKPDEPTHVKLEGWIVRPDEPEASGG